MKILVKVNNIEILIDEQSDKTRIGSNTTHKEPLAMLEEMVEFEFNQKINKK